jgi:hypothetical protein
MGIRYRITSIFVLSTLLLFVASAFFQLARQTPNGAGTETHWNPCMLFANYGPMHNLMVLVSFCAFIICISQGLRNRSGPRWLAIAGVLAMILLFEDEWWQIAGQCYRQPSLTLSGVYFGSVLLMFLNHALQPRVWNQTWRRHSRIVRLTSQGILLGFLLLLVVWFGLIQFTLLIGHRNLVFSETLIGNVQRNIGMPAYILFLFAAAITVSRLGETRGTPTGSNQL